MMQFTVHLRLHLLPSSLHFRHPNRPRFRLASELDSGQDGFMPDEILGVDTGNGGHDSGSARLLAIIPIVGVTVLLISFVSGCIICYKWQRVRRKWTYDVDQRRKACPATPHQLFVRKYDMQA